MQAAQTSHVGVGARVEARVNTWAALGEAAERREDEAQARRRRAVQLARHEICCELCELALRARRAKLELDLVMEQIRSRR